MAELLDEKQTEELERKMKSKTRVRGLLIGINLLLVCYLCYAVTTSIISLVKDNQGAENYVSICGKSEKSSKKIYEQFIDDVVEGDFMAFDDSLIISQGRYNKDKNEIKTFDNIQMVNVCSSNNSIHSSYRYEEMGNYLNDGISLVYDNTHQDFLQEGDYIFYSNYQDAEHRGAAVNVNAHRNIKKVFYSLPNEDGVRVQSTLYAYENNKALVLNVKYVETVAEEYFDLVLKGESPLIDSTFNKLKNKGMKVQKITQVDDSKFFNSYTPKIINFIKGDIESVTTHSRVLDPFDKLDNDFNENMLGYGLSSGTLNDFYSDHHIGKLVIDVTYNEDSNETLLDFLDNIFEYIFNVK